MVDRRNLLGPRRAAGRPLPVLRSRGLSALPVTYVGKAATFALMSGVPVGLARPVATRCGAGWCGACGWAFLIWGSTCTSGRSSSTWCRSAMVVRRMPKVPPVTPGLTGLAGWLQPGRGPQRARAAPKLIPVPSLLRSLLSEHLDPGYAAAAASQDRRRTGRPGVALAGAGGAAGRDRVRRGGRPGQLACARCRDGPAGAGRQCEVAEQTTDDLTRTRDAPGGSGRRRGAHAACDDAEGSGCSAAWTR